MKYHMTMHSYEPHNLEIVQSVLACPSFEQLMFPLRIVNPKQPERVHIVQTLADLDLSLVEKELILSKDPQYDKTPHFTLIGSDNDIEVDFSLILSEKLNKKPDRIPDTVGLHFRDQHLTESIINLEILKKVVVEVIPAFRINTANSSDTLRYKYLKNLSFIETPHGSRIVALGWMSYFGKELVEHIGRDRFDRLETCAEKIEIDDGILVVLQEEPFRYDNESHREREAQAIAELGLEDFVQKKK